MKKLLVVIIFILTSFSVINKASAQQNLPSELITYPEMVLHNGQILTADDNFTVAQAVAIRDGKFLKIGKDRDVLPLAGPNTKKIDLKGKTVTPGFYMHHIHLPDYAYYSMLMRRDDIQWSGKWLPGVDKLVWDNVGSLYKDVEKAVAVSKPGEWVTIIAAFQAFPVVNQLKRSVLDAIAPKNPVVIGTPVIESAFAANSLALKLAKVTPETPGYPKGDEARLRGEGEEGGGGSGVGAAWLLNMAAQWSVPTQKMAAALKKKIAEYNSAGITTMGGTRTTGPEINALRELWLSGDLNMRWRLALMLLNGDSDPERALRNVGNLSDLGDDLLRISGMMMGATDGGTFDGGAWMWEPKKQELPGFPNRPYGERGLNDPWPIWDRDLLILRYGWSTAQSHSAGDRGTSEFLKLFEEAKKNPIATSSNQRLAIDHLVAVRPQDVPKFKELGVQASISPWFIFKKEENETTVYQYGTERVNSWMPAKSYIDLGLKPDVEGDIDWAPWRNPLWNLGKLVSRKDDAGRVWNLKEKVTRQEGLWMVTSWAARYNGDEKKLGSIEPGKLADLVVLDKDYMKVPEVEIDKISVVATIVGGKIVYENAAQW